ncbi:MAG: hypothetical protein WAM60_00605, partial [Candidatus Promineifilaceae bacterium]
DLLTFISDVPGVLDGQGDVIASLSVAQTEALIQEGVISGGMIPKVRSALNVLSENVSNVRIVNLEGVSRIGGTMFTRV